MKLKFRKGEGEIISAMARRVLDVYVRWFDKKKKRYCSKQLEEELAGLFPGVSVKKQIRKYYLKKTESAIRLGIIGIIFVLLCVFKNWMDGELKEERYLERNPVGGGDREIVLDAIVGDEIMEDVMITIGEREISKEEKSKYFEELVSQLEEMIKGENEKLNYVNHPLNLLTEWENTGISIYWTSSNYGVLKEDGSFGADKVPKQGIEVELTAFITWDEMECEKTVRVTVFPQKKSADELRKEELLQMIHQEEAGSRTEEYMELPELLQGNTVSWKEKKETSIIWLVVIPPLLVFAAIWGMDKDVHTQYRERNRQLVLEYSEFVSKLQLLIGAGMSMRNAFIRLALDYQKRRDAGGKKRFVYEELMLMVRKLENGASEAEAYDYFARRCTPACYRKLVSIILQNQKKGADGLKESLSVEIRTAFEERKQEARRLGEEAGTKLLFPMIMMMGVVLMIIMIPAYFSFGGI